MWISNVWSVIFVIPFVRYMKSIFPKAEETVILDILLNNDNNIQKTSDALKEMGFERRDPVKVLQQQADAKLEERIKKEGMPIPTQLLPKIRTCEEKLESKKFKIFKLDMYTIFYIVIFLTTSIL